MIRLLLACAVVAGVVVLAPLASAARPVANAARSCKTADYPGSGYFTSLRVRRVSCSTGRSVMKAHYRCRTDGGIRGRCGHVRGYRCSEKRESIPTEYNARVTCRDGRKRVTYVYQQNT